MSLEHHEIRLTHGQHVHQYLAAQCGADTHVVLVQIGDDHALHCGLIVVDEDPSRIRLGKGVKRLEHSHVGPTWLATQTVSCTWPRSMRGNVSMTNAVIETNHLQRIAGVAG
jgi:hypothetical protein